MMALISRHLGPYALWAGLAAILTYGLDRASKVWILYVYDLPAKGSVEIWPFFNLTMVWNHGVTFGLFRQEDPTGKWLLIAVALAIVAGLIFWLRSAAHWLLGLAIGLVIGGAVGNIVDRVRYGAVVDFLHFHAFDYHWYVFNIADAAVVCGVGLILIDSVLEERRARREQATAPPDGA